MSEFEEAKEAYAAIGVDAEEALKNCSKYAFRCIAGREMMCWALIPMR